MSFIRKIKTKSGIYLARVETRRADGKVKQTVIEWLGKAPDTEETLGNRIRRLEAQRDELQTRLFQAREQFSNLQKARLEAGKDAFGERSTEDIEGWIIDLRLRLLELMNDGQWHNSRFLILAVGSYIPPWMAARVTSEPDKHDYDRGRGIIVNRQLAYLSHKKRVEKRRGKDEWRLIDRP